MVVLNCGYPGTFPFFVQTEKACEAPTPLFFGIRSIPCDHAGSRNVSSRDILRSLGPASRPMICVSKISSASPTIFKPSSITSLYLEIQGRDVLNTSGTTSVPLTLCKAFKELLTLYKLLEPFLTLDNALKASLYQLILLDSSTLPLRRCAAGKGSQEWTSLNKEVWAYEVYLCECSSGQGSLRSENLHSTEYLLS